MQITIGARYCGPTSSGNGGWTAGTLAQALRASTLADLGAVRVRLDAPPPLETPLDVTIETLTDDGGDLDSPVAILSSRGTPIATATSAPGWSTEPPPYVTADVAAGTASDYVEPDLHPFPQCFVCGTSRRPADGMRLTPGRLPDGSTACIWRPADAFGSAPLTEAAVWAALDCPSGWTSDLLGRPLVLGTMTARTLRRPDPDQTCVVTGRMDRTEGRRSWTSSALWSPDGDLLARAEHIWFAVDAATFNAILDR
jgi:hypothetical protein